MSFKIAGQAAIGGIPNRLNVHGDADPPATPFVVTLRRDNIALPVRRFTIEKVTKLRNGLLTFWIAERADSEPLPTEGELVFGG
jgi:hypothetical protein